MQVILNETGYGEINAFLDAIRIVASGNEDIAALCDRIENMIEESTDYETGDLVVDGPEPGETMEQLNGKTIEQPNEKRRKRKQEAAETVTADSGSLYTSQSRDLAISQSESKSRDLATQSGEA